MISQLEKTFFFFLSAATSAAGRRKSWAETPAECHRSGKPWNKYLTLKILPVFAFRSKHEADPRGSQALLVTTFFMWREKEKKKGHPCGGSASYLFDFPPNLTFLVPTLSAFHIPSTSGLCAPCSANSSSWKSWAGALPQGCFHEGVLGREGLACRYEQTVTTDGSSVATVLPRPRCSLPPGWRPRPINPKPCHLFGSSRRQKGSCEGCFAGFFSAQTHTCHQTPSIVCLGDLESQQSVERWWCERRKKKSVGDSCKCLDWVNSRQYLFSYLINKHIFIYFKVGKLLTTTTERKW